VNTASFLPGISRIAWSLVRRWRRYSRQLFQYVFIRAAGWGTVLESCFSPRVDHGTEILPKPLKSVVKCLRFAEGFFPATLEMLPRIGDVDCRSRRRKRAPEAGRKIRRLRLRRAMFARFLPNAGGKCSADLILTVPSRCIQVSSICLSSGVAKRLNQSSPQVVLAKLNDAAPANRRIFLYRRTTCARLRAPAPQAILLGRGKQSNRLAGSRDAIARAASAPVPRGYRRNCTDRRALCCWTICSMSKWSSGMTWRTSKLSHRRSRRAQTRRG